MTGINSINEVSRTRVQEADAIQHSAPKPGHAEQTRAQKADTVSLAESADSLASARKAVDVAADVREEKVAEIKQRVQDGTYAVSSQVLARKLLNQQTQP